MQEEIIKWEYKVIGFAKKQKWFTWSISQKDFQEALNMMGEAGWELAGFKDQMMVVICAFKRQIINNG